MLKIGRKGNSVQFKRILDDGYTDITSVMMWMGAHEKYGVSEAEMRQQIRLLKQDETKLSKYDKKNLPMYNAKYEK